MPNENNGNRAHGSAVHKLLALAVSTMVVLALLGAGEFYCRRFMKVHFLGNSRNLFVPNRFGNSPGNLASGEAESFGVKVYTDENGFRIDPQFRDPKSDRAILFLGDSVAFACGVEEQQSAVGLLRRSLANIRLYNSSSIGFCLKNYKDVVDYWLPKHKDVKAAYVLMCLNDIYDGSAIEIRKSLGQAPEDQGPKDMVVLAKRFSVLQGINEWMRSRFKLAIVAKSLVSDTSMRFFSYDLEMYKHSEAYFNPNMDALRQMNERLRNVGITFKVIVLPYEPQLRSKQAAVLLPQTMITTYLREHDIPFVDTTEIFRNTGIRSKELYLFDDAMHFSPLGHRVLADILLNDIRANPSNECPEHMATYASPSTLGGECKMKVLLKKPGLGIVPTTLHRGTEDAEKLIHPPIGGGKPLSSGLRCVPGASRGLGGGGGSLAPAIPDRTAPS